MKTHMKVKFFCIKCDIFTVEEVISMKEKMNYFYWLCKITCGKTNKGQ